MKSLPVSPVNSSRFPLLTLFGASLIAIESSAPGAGFQYVSGSYEGQLGCGLILESLVNDGYYTQWEGDIGAALPPNGWASSRDEISVGDPLVGYANVTLSREASSRTPEGSLDIMLHSRIEAEASVESGLGYWQVAAPDPGVHPSSVAHVDSRCKELTYEIIGDADRSMGDPVTVEFNAALTVSHSINGTGYGGPADVAAYHVSGYLSGEDSLNTSFTVYHRPFDLSAGYVPLLRVNGSPDRTKRIFTRERRQLHVGDRIRIHGGVQPYLNVYHDDEERGAEVGLYEHAIAEHRFTLSACTVSEADPAPVVLADDTFATGDLSGWTPHTGMFGMVVTEPRLDDPGDVALRLSGQQVEPVQVTKMIECRETVAIQFDYRNLMPFAQLDIRLGGQTLDSLSPDDDSSFQQYQNVFDLADFGLEPGNLECALELTTTFLPFADLKIDNILVRTWNIADTYYTWAASYGIGPANADDDGDGTRNGHEFVLQFDPTNPVETFALRLLAVDENAAQIDLQIAYLKPNGIYRLYSADTPTTDPSQATLRTEITPTTATAGVPVSLTSDTPIPTHQFYFLHFEREE